MFKFLVYLVQGRYWDVESASYVEQPTQGKRVVALYNDGEPADEAYLIDTLKFYKLPLGEFAPENSQKSVEERLSDLEDEISEMKSHFSEARSIMVQLQGLSSKTKTLNNGGLKYGV